MQNNNENAAPQGAAKKPAFFKGIAEMFISSAKELKNIRVLTFAAMLLALVTILKMAAFGNDYVKLGLNAIPSNLAYQILGPVSGFFFGVAGDLMGVLVKGQTVNPLITLVAGLTGLLSGLFLYNKPVRLWRVIAAVLTKTIVCSLWLNTWILIAMYNYEPVTIFTSRLAKNAVEAPITIIVYYIIAKAVERVGIFKSLKPQK